MHSDAEAKQFVAEKLTPLFESLKEEHGHEDATGTRPCPNCGRPMQYSYAKKGIQLSMCCEDIRCFYLMT
jgi:hypothetical protein